MLGGCQGVNGRKKVESPWYRGTGKQTKLLRASWCKGQTNILVADSSGPDLQNNYTDCNLYESHTGFACKPALTDETVRSAQKQRDAVLPKQLGRFAQHRFARKIGEDDRGKPGDETRVSVDQLLDVFFDVFALHVGIQFLQHLGRHLDCESAVETSDQFFSPFRGSHPPLSEILNARVVEPGLKFPGPVLAPPYKTYGALALAIQNCMGSGSKALLHH